MSHKILLVDDEPLVCGMLTDFLGSKGYLTQCAESRKEAERLLRGGGFDAAVVDYQLGDGNALELLSWLNTNDVDIPLIILTAHATVELAVQAIQAGADHFLTKPLELPALEVVLDRVLENKRNRRQRQLDQSRRSARGLDPFIGTSAAIRGLEEEAERMAMSESPIRIHGETGTGKGVLARWLHEHGPRREEPFVDINCAGLTPEFLESELFGHRRGAFTGASSNKAGLLEVAHRGTVFLDEIGDVDQRVQPKLLKVLEEKRFRRMGEVQEREVDIRLIAATHQDLLEATQDGRFRSDLYFRISTLPLEIPSLRERREDIPLLAEDILRRLAAEFGRPAPELSDPVLKALTEYRWPGNIRELRNVLERALLLSGTGELTPRELRFEAAGSTPALAEAEKELLSLREIEHRHVERVLKGCDYGISQAAGVLGISRTTLYQKIKGYEIEIPKS